ncbi:MAG: type II toxin-antitoxin system HicA family toxin [FCB group bacterium]|nr:type II toxin-antitoxin system HicA family toxin [FCB group bacterium]
MTPKSLIKILESHGFVFHRQRGSHLVFKHPQKPGKIVVVPSHKKDLRIGTLRGILRQAGLDTDVLFK